MIGLCASLKVLVVILCFAALTSDAKGGRRVKRNSGNSEICLLPPDEGPCRARIPSYYFDKYTENCTQFIYGGCEGNANNFETWALCEEACEGQRRKRPELGKSRQKRNRSPRRRRQRNHSR